MIERYTDFIAFSERCKAAGLDADLTRLNALDMNFLETYQGFILLNLREALPLERVREGAVAPGHILALRQNDALLFSLSSDIENEAKKFPKLAAKPHSEPTIAFYVTINEVVKTYYRKIEEIRKTLNAAEIGNADLDFLAHRNRRLLDRAEDLLAIMVMVRSREVTEIHWDYLKHDFEVLAAQTQNLIDRSRSLGTYFEELRRQLDIRATRALNESVERLTHVMAILTVVGIIISIPNTVATIFGIAKINEEFELARIHFWLWTSTLVAVLLGYLYWRSITGKTTWPKILDDLLNGIRRI